MKNLKELINKINYLRELVYEDNKFVADILQISRYKGREILKYSVNYISFPDKDYGMEINTHIPVIQFLFLDTLEEGYLELPREVADKILSYLGREL